MILSSNLVELGSWIIHNMRRSVEKLTSYDSAWHCQWKG